MFGIKTILINYYYRKKANKLSNDRQITRLMQHFSVDETIHEANISRADLGYGWLHYGIIRQKKPKTLLCIGSRHGFIPAIMAQACKDNGTGIVDFVDAGYGKSDTNNWSGQAYWRNKEGSNCFKNFSLDKHIHMFVQTTAEFKKSHQHKKYDYIYIDGDHSYKGAKFDFDSFWPNLNQTGYMLLHDISIDSTPSEGEYGVKRLFDEVAKTIPHIKINHPNSGLGILQKE